MNGDGCSTAIRKVIVFKYQVFHLDNRVGPAQHECTSVDGASQCALAEMQPSRGHIDERRATCTLKRHMKQVKLAGSADDDGVLRYYAIEQRSPIVGWSRIDNDAFAAFDLAPGISSDAAAA